MALGKFSVIKISITIALFAISISMTAAVVYTVGDSDGWTLPQHIDYNKWATDKTFFIGDDLVFNYKPQYHNVLVVNDQQFQSCNITSPISSYATGHDSIALERLGDFFFICGFPGHCQAGQKLHIQVIYSAPHHNIEEQSE